MYMNPSLLPADIYIVINKSIITNHDNTILNKLYSPIMGPIPTMLYNLLISDLDSREIISEPNTHAKLLASMHITSNELENARNVLEAVGLLKTYIKEDEVNNYIYELYSPISAHEFFSHPIFNIILYSNIGKREYDNLINYFKLPKIGKENYRDITHTFNEVFDTIPCTSSSISNENIRKYNKIKLNINSSFDINFLIESINKNVDKKVFTKDLQELIINLAYLYDIDVTKMQNILKTCINERGTINREDLRKLCRSYYQFDHSGVLPTVIEHAQPEYLRKPIGDNSSNAKMIYTFETTSPYDFLKSKHNGAEPPKADIKLIEDLIIDCGLKPGVVNVLVDYILKTHDKKLSRARAEKIAGEWSRNKIETVEEAMETARKNHKKQKTTKEYKKNITEKDVPVWLDQNVEANSASLEERKAIEEMLKEYK